MAEHADRFSLSEMEESDVSQYHSVSRLAIASLLLGLVSGLSLVHVVLWILPAAAAISAVFSLRAMSAPNSTLIGRKAAIAGLALALFFGSWTPAAAVSSRYIVASQARNFATDWLELVMQDNLREAHQLSLDPLTRQARSADLVEYYANDSTAQAELEKVFADTPYDEIRQLGKFDSLEFLGTYDRMPLEEKELLLQRFQIDYEQKGETHSVTLQTAAERAVNPHTGQATWKMMKVSEVPGGKQ